MTIANSAPLDVAKLGKFGFPNYRPRYEATKSISSVRSGLGPAFLNDITLQVATSRHGECRDARATPHDLVHMLSSAKQ
jgi:hypothetical protein